MIRINSSGRGRVLPLLLAGLIALNASAQDAPAAKPTPNGWHQKDLKTQGYYGISLDKAYSFLKGRKSKPVVVAVIDSGIDTTHEDLRPVLWTNPKEIPGNGIDDDKNGYVDDVHGWNFLGNKDGRNVTEDSYEGIRFYYKYKSRFENADSSALTGADLADYIIWKQARTDLQNSVKQEEVASLSKLYPVLTYFDSILRKATGKETFGRAELRNLQSGNMLVNEGKRMFDQFFSGEDTVEYISNKILVEYVEGKLRSAQWLNAPPKNYRGDVTQDNEDDINDRSYGNNDVMATTPLHGTHVAGIIGAVRNNGVGVNGVADNVRIMAVRAVPDGDEHDKDIALAIRYAVDNGARVINMSFGKAVSPQKGFIDDAVRYAASKGVLLVQASGNSSRNLDGGGNFPTPVMLDSSVARNWIVVDAGGDPGNGGIVASFSNYGKSSTDVFAPGKNIYSTVPGGNTYGNLSGTSMASPVTAGLAALIFEYFPNLTPEQVAYIIENSAVKLSDKVTKPGTDEQVPFSELSRSGGLINAYNAVKMAADVSSGKMKLKIQNDKIKVKDDKGKTKTKVKSF